MNETPEEWAQCEPHRGQLMTFDQWYGNRPANRKQVSREVWYAALAHAPELARLRAECERLRTVLEHIRSFATDRRFDLNVDSIWEACEAALAAPPDPPQRRSYD